MNIRNKARYHITLAYTGRKERNDVESRMEKKKKGKEYMQK